MSESQNFGNSSQTMIRDANDFQFETIEQQNGQATIIRFEMNDASFHAGDIVVVLSGSEVHFHGMIGSVADGFAVASDHRGSLLPATVQ